ncbi:MAG: M48 family metalloprotease [Desulfobacca sp.]|uniref:M48 family metalloprotease n=1 Tax=Desulfobacca sp. TaxID=2067990 RepID=UPI0040498B59
MKSLTSYLLLTLLVLGAAGCGAVASTVASLPGVPESVKPAVDIAAKTGEKAIAASRELSPTEEYYLGRGVAARILARYPLSKDQAQHAYVTKVGQTVAHQASGARPYKDYHFAVLESSTPNSFACPGGIILITQGMLKACANEDQLAAVLAHEVGHVANRDGVHAISQARWTEVATTAGAEIAKQYGGPLGRVVAQFEGAIDDVFKTVIVNGYSRAAEENADRAGVQMLQRAGYNPAAMTAILTAMSVRGGRGGILGTHPTITDRLENIKALAQEANTQMEPVRTRRFQALVKP